MNQSVFKTLEYAKIITMLQNMATSSMGKELAEKLLPSSDIDEVIENLSHTQEASNILISSEPPFGGIHDIRSLLKKTSLGLVIEINSLLDILNTMYAMRNLKKFFKELEIDSPQFKEWAKSIEILGQLEREIDNIVDEHGSMRDSASVELMRIRREIKSSQRRIKTNLDGILKNPDYQKYFQDNIVTIRDERYVIPIKQEYRQQFPGVVHDQSSSGSTLFIEPMSIVDLNNDIKQLVIDEKREIERILKVISEKIARNADSLLHNCEIMAQLDFAFAKAKLARKMHATMPEINDEGIVNLAKARHPLLNKDNVVPIDIRLGEGYRTLLITGPNTGGKTVSMKTLGLLVLMTQSGLFIPVQSGSKISIFQNVYADIGDEQSIEQSLSTFSAHMRNIVNIKLLISRSTAPREIIRTIGPKIIAIVNQSAIVFQHAVTALRQFHNVTGSDVLTRHAVVHIYVQTTTGQYRHGSQGTQCIFQFHSLFFIGYHYLEINTQSYSETTYGRKAETACTSVIGRRQQDFRILTGKLGNSEQVFARQADIGSRNLHGLQPLLGKAVGQRQGFQLKVISILQVTGRGI